jgi:hypothetical protein
VVEVAGDLAVRVLSWASAVGLERPVRVLSSAGWLADPGFVARCVVVLRGEPPAAMVDWVAAATFLARLEGHGDAGAVAALGEAIDLAGAGQGGRLRVPGEAGWCRPRRAANRAVWWGG